MSAVAMARETTDVRVLLIHNRPVATAGGYERLVRGVDAALRRAGHETELHVPRAHSRWRRPRLPSHACDVACLFGMGFVDLRLLDRLDVPAVGVVGDGWMVYGPEVTGTSADLSRVRWLFISEAVRKRAPVDGAVVHPGVDPAAFPFTAPGPWRWRLAYVGRVADGKGVGTARAAAGLLDEATLVVDGPGGDVCTPADRVHEAYAAADAILFPVEWPEPWGLVPLEAMSVGRPVVATGTGGSGEYLRDGENCLLFPPGDADALAGCVRRLAEDAGLRARLVAGGRETAARFTAAAFEERVVAEITARVAAR